MNIEEVRSKARTYKGGFRTFSGGGGGGHFKKINNY